MTAVLLEDILIEPLNMDRSIKEDILLYAKDNGLQNRGGICPSRQIRCQQCDINVIWSGYCRKRMIDFPRLTDNVFNKTSNKQGAYAYSTYISLFEKG